MLTRTQKEERVVELRDKFARASAIFLADYRGITVQEIGELRSELRSSGDVEYQVVKNSLLRLAVEGSDAAVLAEHFNGPTSIAVTTGDAASLAKILVDYSKKHEVFELKGALLDGAAMGTDEIEVLATLPSLDELRATLVGLVQAPATKLVRLLCEPGAQLARVVKARQDALEESGSSD